MKVVAQLGTKRSLSGSVELRINKSLWLSCGFSFKQVALGISLNKYQLNVDALFFWFSVEF